MSLVLLAALGLTACQNNSRHPAIAILSQTLAVSGRGMVNISDAIGWVDRVNGGGGFYLNRVAQVGVVVKPAQRLGGDGLI